VDLFTLDVVEMCLSGVEQGERAGNFECFGEGDVVIGDQAYGTIQGMEYLRGRGSNFVFRLRSQAFTVYTAEGEKADLAGRFEGLGEGESGEVTVYYKAGDEYRPVRICARRKSEEEERQGRERMEKTNRRKGRGEASESQDAYNRYIIVATSLDGVASAGEILELYRMRWAIEMVFKRLKSLFHYNEIPWKLEGTAKAWFYGKLLLAAFCETVVNSGRFSPCGEQNTCERMESLVGT
jgi:IS4 transposase